MTECQRTSEERYRKALNRIRSFSWKCDSYKGKDRMVWGYLKGEKGLPTRDCYCGPCCMARTARKALKLRSQI